MTRQYFIRTKSCGPSRFREIVTSYFHAFHTPGCKVGNFPLLGGCEIPGCQGGACCDGTRDSLVVVHDENFYSAGSTGFFFVGFEVCFAAEVAVGRACTRAWARVDSTAAIHPAAKRVSSVHWRRLLTASPLPTNSSATASPVRLYTAIM